MTQDRITRAIVDFALARHALPLTGKARDALLARLIDSLGCGVAACAEPEVARLAAAIGAGGAGECAVLMNGRATPERAAFLNGLMIRYLDWNDTYVGRNGGHPSDLIAAALAAGEYAGKSGDEVLRAIGVGYHVMLDLCDGSNALARGWDHGAYVGLAAVVAAGLLLDLDAPRLASALSMMAASGNMLLSRAGKLSAWRGLASPHAARNAVALAMLARSGVSGPDPVFEGEQGFLALVSGDMNLELDLARDRGGDSHLKMYPAVFHAQAPVELALAIRRDLLAEHGPDAIASIEAIEVETHAFAIKWAAADARLWRPDNRETADHSIPYMVALALARGDFGHHDIEAALGDERVMALTREVVVREDADHSRRWPGEANARLRVVAAGRTHERSIVAGTGHAANPIAPEHRSGKLLRAATEALGAPRAREWARRLEDFAALETIGAALTP